MPWNTPTAMSLRRELVLLADQPDANIAELDRSRSRVSLERLPPRLVAVHLRQAADAVALQAPVDRGACQVRDRRLPWTETGLRQSSRGSRVWRRKATTIASPSAESTVERGCFGPIDSSAVACRRRHLARVLRSMPWRRARAAMLSWLRSMDRRPAGARGGRCRVEAIPQGVGVRGRGK